jgi:acetolactate synthase-1/2/3 large subunit
LYSVADSTGSDLLVRQLVVLDVRDFFFVIGGPMSDTIGAAVDAGIRGIDTRDERAATFAAIAYSRLTGRPGVVMTCSGPGTTNTVTGLAHAHADGAPVIVLGGSTARYLRGTGAFQELDQVALMRPVTKLAHEASDPEGVPDAVSRSFHAAMSGAPGPVYLDLPSDVLYGAVTGEADPELQPVRPLARSGADPASIGEAVKLLTLAERPVLVFGSGALWSGAAPELADLVDRTGIPFYSTPMTRGLVPEDHALSFPAARSTALREADCLLVVGTRDNYVLNHLKPPVVNGDAAVIQVNIDPADVSRNRAATVGIVADAKLALQQLLAALDDAPLSIDDWTTQLASVDLESRQRSEEMDSDGIPIHPQRLCAEVDRVRTRSTVVVVDGAAILDFARRTFLGYEPGRFMTPGVFGTMGIGVPFGLAAKLACPSDPVIVLTGDGAFGYHALELDTAARHGLGFVVVVANNGGWTSKRGRPGYSLDFSDYHLVARALGCSGARVDQPDELPAALDEALAFAARERKPAVVNAIISTDRLRGRSFSRYARHAGGGYDAA